MAHNTVLSAPVGTGDTIVDVDLSLGTYPTSSGKLSASCLYVSANTSTAPTPVTSTNALYVQPGTSSTWAISAASLPLPSGAATSANQPGLGTAGSANANVLTVQGIASMTPLLVTLSGTNNIATVSTVTSLSQWNGTAIDTNSGNKSAGTLRVVLATDQPALTNKLLVTPDANSAVNVAQVNGVTVLMGNGVTGTGSQRVTIASDNTAFSVNAIQSGTWTVQPGNTANTTAWLVAAQATTSGGTSAPYTFLSTAAVQAANIKASAGQVYALHFFNINATPVYVRLYNQTTSPSSGDSPVYRAIVPGNTAGAGFVVALPPGVSFATGIGIRVTNSIADNDNTALAANTVIGNVFYK